MARPRTEMTPENIAAILRTVELGVWPDRAAAMHGVSPGTMRSMRMRDKAFATALKKAEAKAESGIHGKILRHMDKQWTACAWMLERRWPERWAKRDHVEVSTKGDAKKLLEDLHLIRERASVDPPEKNGTA